MLMNLHSGLFFSLNLIPFLNGKYFRTVAPLNSVSIDDDVQIASQLLNARCKPSYTPSLFAKSALMPWQ